MAKCIVCGEETGNRSTCQMCGFSTKFPVFLNREEYEQWVRAYLTPRRELWRAKKEAQRQAEERARREAAERARREAEERARREAEERARREAARTKGTLSKERFHSLVNQAKKETLTEIRVLNQLSRAPARSTDISEEQNRSVLGWTDGSVVYLAGEGGIRLPDNCRELFECFSALKRIVGAEYLDTSCVSNMFSMFNHCSSLNALDVSQWDTSNVRNMCGMFGYCSSLTTLDVSRWDTSCVTDMDRMFRDCSSLTTLDVSRWNTSRVTDMILMFCSCSSLKTLNALGWNTRNVNRHENMFYGVNLRQNPGIRPPRF